MEKCLVSILWSVHGIYSLLDVAKGTKYNTAFFTDTVIPDLIENFRLRTRKKTLKDWLIYMDNARPHNSGRAERRVEASRGERLPHPPYNPDLTASDFLLFGYIKGKLSNYNCESPEDLLNAITEISTGVNQEGLLCIFESRENRRK
jgi:histone-lysine N-methyltransferase SETMAR